MKRNKTVRRLLGLTLALAMLLPGLGLLAGIEAAASLQRVTADTTAPIDFIVPETIYLKKAVGASTVFDRYANGGPSVAKGTEATGRVVFTVPAGAAAPTLACTGAAPTVVRTNAGNTYTWTISGGTTPAVNANDGKTIEWKVTYTLGGETFTSVSYSYVYAPSNLVAGASGDANTSSWWSAATLGAIGFHSVAAPNPQYTYVVQERWPVSGGSANWGTGNYARRVVSPNAYLINDLVFEQYNYDGRGTAAGGGRNNTLGWEAYLTAFDGSKGYIPYGQLRDNSGDDYEKIISVYGAEGTVNVDTSHYDNLSQIPGLRWQYAISSDENTNGEWDDTYWNLDLGIFFTNNSNNRWQNDRIQDLPGNGASSNDAQGWNAGLSKAVAQTTVANSSDTDEYWLWGQHFFAGDNLSENWIGSQLWVRVKVNRLNKSNIRAALNAAVTMPQEKMANAAAVAVSLRTAAEKLGNPKDTSEEYSVTAAVPSVISQAPTVYFTAPETIYLTPSAATSGNVAWQYFADNAVAAGSAANATAAATYSNYGTVALSVLGATEVSIHCITPGVTVQLGYLKRYNGTVYQDFGDPGTLSGSNTDFSSETTQVHGGAYIYGRIKASGSSSNYAGGLITWRATYVVAGVRYEAYTYSYVYKPYTEIYGIAEHAQDQSGSTSDVESATYFMGVHSVDRETLDVKGHASNDNYRQIWDYDTPTKDSDGNGGGSGNGRWFHTLAYSGSGQPGSGNWITDFLNASSTHGNDGKGSFAFKYYYASSGNSNLSASSDFASPAGNLFVDVSRYSSVYQVPNFQWYTILSSDDDSDNTWVWEFPGFLDTNWNSGNAWTSNGTYYVYRGYNNNSSDEFIAGPNLMSDRTLPQGYSNGGGNWKDSSLPWNALANRTRYNGSNKGVVQYREYNYTFTDNHSADQGYKDQSDGSQVRGHVRTNLLCVDKSALRSKLQATVNLGIQQHETTGAKWLAYETALRAVATALCQPDYNLTPANVTTLNNALDAAVSAIRGTADSLSAKAYHYSKTADTDPTVAGNQAPATLAAETMPYTFGDLVAGGAEDIPGYTYANEHYSFKGTVPTWAGSSGTTAAIAEANRKLTETSSTIAGVGDILEWKFYYNPISYSINYVSEGTPTGMPGNAENIAYDVYHQVPGSTPNRGADYQFVNWLCDANSVTYVGGDKVWKLTAQQDETVTMHAQYNYKVTFIVQGTNTTTGKFYAPGTTVQAGGIPVGTPAVEGWYADEDFTTVYLLSDTVTAPITIYGKLANLGAPTLDLLAQQYQQRVGSGSSENTEQMYALASDTKAAVNA
ncbi:MAG: hypothetical protein LBC83_06970, partial [Oscillospiraceae bacterium]|nr:hypothetical protein [Oscillospiraceae bacterium]